MRLIDADSLVQYLTSRKCECVDDVGKSWNYGIDTAIRVVDQCITIDAKPVRHGHWECVKPEKDGVYGSCSICGYEAATTFHCPNCGAKMDNGG